MGVGLCYFVLQYSLGKEVLIIKPQASTMSGVNVGKC